MAVRSSDGVDDVITVATPPYFTTFTFASVIKRSTASLTDGHFHAPWGVTKPGDAMRLGFEFKDSSDAEVQFNGTGKGTSGTNYDRDVWALLAVTYDGTTFVVQAPEAFTQEQVLELAESVTYHP